MALLENPVLRIRNGLKVRFYYSAEYLGVVTVMYDAVHARRTSTNST